jgi:hypothetical protein
MCVFTLTSNTLSAGVNSQSSKEVSTEHAAPTVLSSFQKYGRVTRRSLVSFEKWSDKKFGVQSSLVYRLSYWFDNVTHHYIAIGNVLPSK